MNVAISGKFCSGKDTVADYLVQRHDFYKMCFAAKLYEIAEDLFGMVRKDRSLLQALGDGMRQIRPTVWVDYVMNHSYGFDHIVISDMRYLNELAQMKRCAWLIRLNCSSQTRAQRYHKLYECYPTSAQENFISEVELDGHEAEFDLVIDTDIVSKEEMFKIIDDFLLAKTAKQKFERIDL